MKVNSPKIKMSNSYQPVILFEKRVLNAKSTHLGVHTGTKYSTDDIVSINSLSFVKDVC